jgi:ankyrin repeat protein
MGSAEGNTPLLIAADDGHDDICRLLIEAGARIDHRGYADNTALFLAAAAGHINVVDMLLRAGASVDKRGAGMGDGDTSDTPLTRAAYEGRPAVVRLLLRSGASVNARSEPSGGTALHEAIAGGRSCHGDEGYQGTTTGKSTQRLRTGHRDNHDEVISILIANGAALDLRSHAGDSPLLAAISSGCLHIVKLLIQAGANVDIASHPAGEQPGIGVEGQTPLIATASLGEPEIAEELLRAGASTSPRDETGSNALDWARGSCDENPNFDCAARTVRKRQVVKMLRTHMSSHGVKAASNERVAEVPKQLSTADTAGGAGYLVAIMACAAVAAVSWLFLFRAERWQEARASAQLWLRALGVLTPEADPTERRGHGRRRGRGRTRASQAAGTDAQGLHSGAVRAESGAQAIAEATDEPHWWIQLEEFHDDLEVAARQERPEFTCSLTHEIMRCPANLVDGEESHHTYEHNAIVAWFQTGSTTDPISRKEIDPAQRTIVRDNRLQREIRSWCEAKVDAFRRELAVVAHSQREDVAAPPQMVHVFVDHSNVAIGAARAGCGPDLNVDWLVRHVEAGREVKERVVIGSYESERTRDAWEAMGYSVATDSRRGPERFVDDALHAQLMRTAARRFERPHTIALVTGDGNCNEGRTTFPECIEEALKNDWHVELYSWRSSTSQVYVVLAEQYASHFTVRYLDDAPASSDGHGSGAAALPVAGRGRGGRGSRRGTGKILASRRP